MGNRRIIKDVYDRIKSIDFLPLVLAYLIMIVFFSITSQYFFSVRNFMNIALYAAIVGTLACSTTLVIAAGKIDFAAGSVIALGSCVMCVMMRDGYGVWPAIGACMAVALFVGALDGFLIAYVGINPFIATLASMQMFRGFAYIHTNALSIDVMDPVLKFMGRDFAFGIIPNAVILMLIIVVVFVLIASKTTLGRKFFVVGGNERVAFLTGINVKFTIFILFVVHGAVTGIAAILWTAQLGAALPSAAPNLNFQAISAAVLGGVSLTGGKGSIVGAIVGALLLGTLNNGMVMLDIQSFWQDVIIGFVLIFAVTLDIIKNKRASTARNK